MLGACEPQTGTAPAEDNGFTAEVATSASLGPFDSHINALAFVPVATVPWEGRLIMAPSTGGLKVIDIEGEEDSQWQGDTINALAAKSGFNLRGLGSSMVLALTSEGTLRTFIVDDARGQLIEAPVSGLPTGGITALCLVRQDEKDPEFLIGQDDKTLAIWRIRDTGDAALKAQKVESGKLSITIKNCTATRDGAIATGDKGGLFSLSLKDKIGMIAGVESAPGKLASLLADGAQVILVSDPTKGNLRAYDANLLPLYTLKAPKALSTPGAANPGALATSAKSFGGSGFSAGLIAVADDSTNRIALVVLDTIPASVKEEDS